MGSLLAPVASGIARDHKDSASMPITSFSSELMEMMGLKITEMMGLKIKVVKLACYSMKTVPFLPKKDSNLIILLNSIISFWVLLEIRNEEEKLKN